ncbi:hypothetical protein ACEPAH_1873 [Sanghuangporus vaninii]
MASKIFRIPLSGACRCRFALSARGVSSTTSSLSADDLSSVHRGTAFENRAMMMLRYLSMSLTRIGGRSDGGVDLQGWWWLPATSPTSQSTDPEQADLVTDNTGIHRRRIRVLAQCKAERKKLGPNYVREMEGVLYRHLHLIPSHEQDTKTLPTVALLVSESEFTKATVLCALSSPLPFFLLHLPRHSSETSKVAIEGDRNSTDGFVSAIWNPALGGQKGILGGEIDLRWELSQDPTIPRRPSLWFHSTHLESWVPLSER